MPDDLHTTSVGCRATQVQCAISSIILRTMGSIRFPEGIKDLEWRIGVESPLSSWRRLKTSRARGRSGGKLLFAETKRTERPRSAIICDPAIRRRCQEIERDARWREVNAVYASESTLRALVLASPSTGSTDVRFPIRSSINVNETRGYNANSEETHWCISRFRDRPLSGHSTTRTTGLLHCSTADAFRHLFFAGFPRFSRARF